MFDTQLKINYYFNELCKIPHGSYHEKELSDYIMNFAKEHHLQYIQDELYNVIIFKEASESFEGKSILLQAHIDMVNEKDKDSNHNFDTDPLQIYEKDNWLYATKTTLGADDGAGVAYMLALLDDDTLSLPALECVFTVQEEVGLCGATYLDTSMLKSKMMINLDSEITNQICISSSGSVGCDISKEITWHKNENPCITVEIDGLSGGHSGGDINKYKGNSIRIVARILYYCMTQGIDVSLVSLQGGSKVNAIPRDASVTFSTSQDIHFVTSTIESIFNTIKEELKENDPNVFMNLSQTTSDQCIGLEQSKEWIQYLYLSINGCLELSQRIENLPLCSLNLGLTNIENNQCTASYFIRSPEESKRNDVLMQLDGLANLCHCQTSHGESYSGWTCDKDSKLLTTFKKLYYEKTGIELKEYATHGGLETGVFKGKMPDLDIITIGPEMEHIHSPKERLNLVSFKNMYELLIEFIQCL
ncbi:beta-Ala-His dipeptidase [Floccifex sp.]|uniref:beta-Ala-His dipeptidase n=1 Tax=Floccifex sp. TaxID=2815810 RepID=UPI002A74D409|nr:beta-Ala-His dipeptidase [Floccifex sp.]MDD7280720.1 beta-Ala-His dipeptidase [Erysipelotrichaceae bacterium]MDY2959150.1 beta-Ala-His dipeptidase [Floccifex sp.]